MTPKEKAEYLIDLYYAPDSTSLEQDMHRAKCNAIFCVDEILNLGFLTGGRDYERVQESQLWYWLEVKLVIENS